MKHIAALVILLSLSVSAFAQHDPGRETVRLLAKDQTEAAATQVAKATKRKNGPLSDAEKYYLLAMIACREGDSAAAFEHARQAVDNGLPIERLQAGPRDVFAPLYANSKFKAWLAQRQKQLLHGPLLGAVTDSSATFWVRTAEEADVRIIVHAVSQNRAKTAPLGGRAKTSRTRDYTATIRVSRLEPNTQYRYELFLNNKKIAGSARFRTFLRPGTSSRFSIAFGGGAGFTPKHERMWTTIAKRSVRALLLLGDNVYIDDPTHQMTQRYCYYRRQSQPDWRRLVASTSVFSIYDDHDFGTNDCVPGPDIEKPAWKRKVWEIFAQNWANPAYGGSTQQPGCWYSFYIADVHFIMLDCRYYRDLKGGTMLGPVQKKWLFETLKSSKGTFKVLASSVPWSPGVKPRSRDTWDGFKDEREEIFSFLDTNRISGVVLMAADRHRSDLRKITRPEGYDLYEVMSSRLTNVHTHGLMKQAKGSEFIMGFNTKCSFGLLEFDTTLADPQVKYTIVDIDNEEIDSRTLKLSQLTSPVRGGDRKQDKNELKNTPGKE